MPDTTISPTQFRPSQLSSLALRAFLVLLGVNALVAITAILGGGGDTEWRVLLTSMLITAGCLVVAANAGAVERARLGVLPHVSAVVACGGIALLIIGIWDHDFLFHSDGAIKLTLILLAVGTAGTYASLISLPQLDAGWNTARIVGYSCAASLAALTSGAILYEEAGPFELYGILSVVLATASILVPVGARVSKGSGAGSKSTPVAGTIDGGHPMERVSFCPVCGAPRPVAASPSPECPTCGAEFRVAITRPRSRF